MGIAAAFVLGSIISASLFAGWRLLSAPTRVLSPKSEAMRALYSDERLRPEDTPVVSETAGLVAAPLELAELEAQDQRLARAELVALRAQISPHFIYNALAAVASLIRTSPHEARELIAEFAAVIRYAFRGERPYVTLADELHYVEKYLRLGCSWNRDGKPGQRCG